MEKQILKLAKENKQLLQDDQLLKKKYIQAQHRQAQLGNGMV